MKLLRILFKFKHIPQFRNFKNLQLLTKSLQANMVTTMLSMLFMLIFKGNRDVLLDNFEEK